MRSPFVQRHTEKKIHIYVRGLLLASMLWIFFGLAISEAHAEITYVGHTSATGLNTNFSAGLSSLIGGSGGSAQEGDLVIVLSAFGGTLNGNPGVATEGYTEIADLYANDTLDANVSVSYKIMGAIPDTTVSCRGSTISNYGTLCVVNVWRGIDVTSPLDVPHTTAIGTNSAVPNPPAITPITEGAYISVFGASAFGSHDISITAPSGYSNQHCAGRDPGAYAATGCIASKQWTSGTEDPAAWTDWTSSGDASWGAVTVALRPAPQLALSGTLYTDEGVTPITTGKTIKVAYDGELYTATTDGSGEWGINPPSLEDDVPAVIWVDGDVSTRAALVVRPDIEDPTGLDLYENKVIVRSEDGDPVSIDDLALYSGMDDEDIQYVVKDRSLLVQEDQNFLVWEGTVFRDQNSAVTFGGSVRNNGTLDLSDSSVYFASDGAVSGGGVLLGDVVTGSSESVLINDGVVWTARSAAEANVWTNIAYGNGMFVAVAESGTNRVMTSEDGINWTARSASEANPWYSVTYGNGLFVAVSGSGAHQVMTSPDGIDWTARSASEANSWQSVTYGNGTFVAVSSDGTNRVMTSPDGINWTSQTAPSTVWASITYGNGLFVAIERADESWGDTGNEVMTSEDGISWTLRSSETAQQWNSITYGNGKFVAVGRNGSVQTSTDGITWVSAQYLNNTHWSDISYGGGLFVAVGLASTAETAVATSPDGINWTARSASEANPWYSVTYGNGLFVAVSGSGAHQVMTSDSGRFLSIENFENNGEVWVEHEPAEASDWHRITYGNGTFVAVSADGDVMTSPDGETWTSQEAAESNQWQSITYGNGTFVAIADEGTNRVMSSKDGINWTAHSVDSSNWRGVTFGNNLFVAVSFDGDVMTSEDGETWIGRTESEASEWTSVTYGNGLFVAVAEGGTNRVMISPDGINWTSKSAALASNWYDVVYGEGLFVAVSTDDDIMTSPNGETWTARTAPAGGGFWYSVTYGNGLFVALSYDGTNRIMTSPDGITWTAQTYPSKIEWHDVVFAQDMFVAVAGGDGSVMISEDGSVPTTTITLASDVEARDLTIAENSVLRAPDSLVLTGDYANNGTFVAREGNITVSLENTVDGYDLSIASYDSVLLNITETNAYGMDFSRDGEHLYVLGYDNDDIRWYTLSVPWDISTASYEGAFNVGGLDDYPNAVYVKDDGTKVYFTGDTNDAVGELSLSTPYDITTASFVDALFVTEETKPFGLAFSPDGDRLYLAGDDNDSVHSYTLSPAWDVSTAVYEESFSFSSQDSSVSGIHFSTDGTKLFFFGWEDVYAYTLATPWDISTASYADTFSPTAQVAGGMQVKFSDDGAKMYILDIEDDAIFQYTTGTEGEGTPDTDKTFSGNMTGESAFNDLVVSAKEIEITFSDDATVGDLTIGSTATVIAPLGTLTVSGDLTNNGDLSTTGEVVLAGAGSTVRGDLVGDNGFTDLVIDVIPGVHNDGVVWDSQSASEANSWQDVTFGNGTFVAVSSNGTNRIMTSPDGITWTARSAPEANQWTSVTHGNGMFVAVAQSGTNRVMSSYDGITWTARSAATAASWSDVTYGNGMFVAVAADGRVMTSEDGLAWDDRGDQTDAGWYDVTYGEGLFVIVGDYSSGGGSGYLKTSYDGITWTFRESSDGATAWNSVTYGNGIFVAVGYSSEGIATDIIATSPNGLDWTTHTAPEANMWSSVEYDGDTFVAVCLYDSSFQPCGELMTSPDGEVWTLRDAAQSNQWTSVTFGNGTFVAVSSNGTNRVMTSQSGEPIEDVVFADTASTTNLTILQGELVAPEALTVSGDFANTGGAFTHNDGVIYFDGSSAQDLSGALTGTSSLNTVIFSGTGNKVFSDNATTGNFTIRSEADVQGPALLTVAGSYTNEGAFDANGGRLTIQGALSASTAYVTSTDITTASYDGEAFSVASEETQVTSLAFKTDGTAFYINGYNSDAVTQYDMSEPWDVSTASYSDEFSTASQDGFVEKIAFSSDGTKLYALGSANDRVYQYTLSVPWDVTTATYDSISLSVTALDSTPFGMHFKEDGTRLFIAGSATDRIYSYTLSTPWNVASAGYDGKYFSVDSWETSVQDVAINSEGTEMYIIGYNADTINQFTLSTPWDLTTANFSGSKSVTAQESIPDGLEFMPDGSRFYVHGEDSGNILAYSFDSELSNILTGTTTLSGNMTGSSAFNDLVIDMPQQHVADAETWVGQNESENNTWSSITYGNGIFVALAYSGTNRVMTSPDGINWTSHSASEANSWNSVVYGNGTFVAVAGNGTHQVMTSEDGENWTPQTAAAANEWYSVTYGNGIFVAVAHNNINGSATCSTDCVMTSPDGITWTAQTAAAANLWERVTYGEGLFVAIASDGDGLVMTSPDGINWTLRNTPGSSWYGITYGNGTFVAVAYDWVMRSEDGIYWEPVYTTYEANGWQSVTYGGGLFVAISPDGTNRIMTSPDGETWTPHIAPNDNKWWDIAYGNNTFVAVAQQTNGGSVCTTTCVMTSQSGDLFGAVVFDVDDVEVNDLTITSGTVIPQMPESLTLSGDYTNNGQVEFGTGTTTFNGTDAQAAMGTMTGASAFYNVELSNTSATTSFESALGVGNQLTATSGVAVAFPAGATTTVASFNMTGTDGGEIILRSTEDGVQWNLDVEIQVSVVSVDVKDSNACSGKPNMTATDSIDSGNNTCWDIAEPAGVSATISSASNQVFGLDQAPASIAVITITDAVTPTITAANDLRIAIDGSKTDMKWDTTDSTATFGGTASSKVSNPVSYENDGRTLVVPVSTNFAANDTLTISGLSYADFASTNEATSTLSLVTSGAITEGGGNSWTAHPSTEQNGWRSVTYGNGLFVAVSSNGTYRVMISEDGENWTAHSASEANSWQDVTYGNGLFVAVSSNGTNRVMTSLDGITWTARTAAEQNDWYSVTYGNGLFVAVSQGGTNQVMTSEDGINWTAHSAADASYWTSVTYGNGLFVAVAYYGANQVMTSEDGINWTAHSAAEESFWYSVTYGNGTFVAVSYSGTNQVMTSEDGINWTAHSAAEQNDWYSVTYGNGTFVAVAGSGTNRVMTSLDGITWTARTAAEANPWFSVTYGNGLFVAVSQGGTNRVMTSGSLIVSTLDDKTVAILNTLTLSEHTEGQTDNAFSYQDQTGANLFRFNIAPAGSTTVSNITFSLTGIRRIDSSNLTDIRLYVDDNSDGSVDGGDTAIGGNGVLTTNGASGSIAFTTPWSMTTAKDYILISDIADVKINEFMTISLLPSKITSEDATATGEITDVQHIRGGNGGASAHREIGGDAPEGDGDVGGGGQGGGGGAGEEEDGEIIGNESGFRAPTTTGTPEDDWAGGTNAYLSDGVYATVDQDMFRQTYGGFGFAIPSGNVIKGIEIKIEGSTNQLWETGGMPQVCPEYCSDHDIDVFLPIDNEVKGVTFTLTDQVYRIGGPADLWSAAWDPADFSDENFYIMLLAPHAGTREHILKVDAIQVRVYHQAGGGGGGGGGEI